MANSKYSLFVRVACSRPSNVKHNFALSEELEWTGEAFTIGKQIGSGSFATVFMGTHNGTGATFAIKKVPLPSGQNFRRQKVCS